MELKRHGGWSDRLTKEEVSARMSARRKIGWSKVDPEERSRRMSAVRRKGMENKNSNL